MKFILKEGKLVYNKAIKSNYKYESIKNAFTINENEIVFSITNSGRIYGYNSYIVFYDIKKNKEIKSLNIGDNIEELLYMNPDNLVSSVPSFISVYNEFICFKQLNFFIVILICL